MADDLGNIISNMDNMSIEELGSSLLTRQSKINAEREKEARKSQKIQNALALIGIGQALTKDAVKKRSEYINQTQTQEMANNPYQAEQWTVNANVINTLDAIDFTSPEYKEFTKNTNFNNPNTFYNFGENPTEGDKRAAYVHHIGSLDTLTTQLLGAINKSIENVTTPKNYEKIINDTDTYQFLIDGAGLDLARDFYTDIGTDGIYKPKYESMMEEATDLLTMGGYVDMDRAMVLETLMGLSPAKLNNIEKSYFNNERNIRNKGILGGFLDIGRKMFGISKRNGTVNIFDSASKQDFYGNRSKNDGQFELNVASTLQSSSRDRVTAIKTGANSELPIDKDTRAKLAFKGDEELLDLVGLGNPDIPNITEDDGFFNQNVYASKSWKEQRNDINAHLAIPKFKNKKGDTFGEGHYSTTLGRKFRNYTDDLSPEERIQMADATGILAKEMELNEEWARELFTKMSGTIEGIDILDEDDNKMVNNYFDVKYSTTRGRAEMAFAMVARNGLYSVSNFARERYEHSSDIIDTFDKSLYPPKFNKNGGFLSELNNNIYIDKEGFKIKEDYYNLHIPQRANVFHTTFEGIMNHNMPEEQRQNMMDSFFETIDHPVIGPTSLGQYTKYYSNEETRPILMATDEINFTEPANNNEIMKNFNRRKKDAIDKMNTLTNPFFQYERTFRDNPLSLSEGSASFPSPEETFLKGQDILKNTKEYKNKKEQEQKYFRNRNIENVTNADIFGQDIQDTPLYDENTREELSNYGNRMNNVFVASGFTPIPFDDAAHKKTNTLISFIASNESGNESNPLIATNPDSTAKGAFQITDETAKTAIVRLVDNSKFGDYKVPNDIQVLYDEIIDEGLESIDVLRLSPTSQTLLAFSNLIERPVSIDGVKQAGLGTELMYNYYKAAPDSIAEAQAAEKIYSLTHHTDAENKNMGRIKKMRYKVGKKNNIESNLRRYYPAWNDFQNQRYNTKKN